MSHDSELMLWQHRFLERPDHLAVIVAKDGEKFVGTLGVMPQPVGICGKVLRGAWIVLWVIDPDYRGQNLGARMIDFIYSNGIEIIPFQGANELAARLHERLGAVIFPRLPRWWAALDLDTCHAMGADPNIVQNEVSVAPSSGVRVLQPEDDRSWDRFFYDHLASRFQGVIRDHEFLQWRYRGHPRYAYRLWGHESASGGVDGILVERVQPALSAPAGALRIVELLGSSDAMIQLARAALHRAREENLAFADFYCSSHIPAESLRVAGFDDHPEANFPNHWNPFGPGDKSICGGIYRAEHLVHDDFYATRADGDQDRPN